MFLSCGCGAGDAYILRQLISIHLGYHRPNWTYRVLNARHRIGSFRRLGGLNSRRAKVSGSNGICTGRMLRSRLSRRDCAPGLLCHGGVTREASLKFVRYSVRSFILSLIQCVLPMVVRGSWPIGGLDRINSIHDSGLEGASHIGKGKPI